MPLLNSTAQVKLNNSAIQSNLKFESIASFRDSAEDDHIIPLIGRAFYNVLIARIADAVNNPLTSPENELIRLLIKASANFTIGYYASFGSVQLSDIGAHVKVSDSQRIASDKKINELKNSSFLNAFKAYYQALEFLHLNKTDTSFATYFSSTNYADNIAFYLQYPSDAKYVEQIRANPWLFDKLKPVQRVVNESYLIPIITEAVLTALQEKIKLQTTSALEKELIKKIQKAVSFLVMAEGVLQNALTVDASGIFAPSESTGGITGNFQMKDHPMADMLSKFVHTYLTRGETELENIKIWLNANADADNFIGYVVQISGALSPMNINSDDNNFFFT
jgi:hypothetical protein